MIVFDLDDTLLDTSGLLIPIADEKSYLDRISNPLPLMEGAKENLDYLSTRYTLLLLSFGQTKIQKQKIDSLGIKEKFNKIFIADQSKGESKQLYFKKIFLEFNLNKNEYLSIGNRRSTDIRMAKKESALTCLFEYGEHTNEKIEIPEDQPDFTIQHHHQLIKICKL